MNQENRDRTHQRPVESVKTILLLGTVGSWAAVATYIFASLKSNNPDYNYAIPIVITLVMSASLSLANFLAIKSKINPAIWLSIFVTEIGFIGISLTIAKLGVILAIILLVIISNLAFQSLSNKTAIFAIITGVIASIAITAIDIILPDSQRIIPEDWLIIITIMAGGIIILVLGIALLRQYQFYSIRSQIIVAFVIISVVPLWTVVAPQLIANSSSLEVASEQALSNSLKNISNNFDAELIRLQDINTNDASLPALLKFVEIENGTAKDILEYFQTIEKRNPNILGYSLFDKNGKNLLDTQLLTKTIDKNNATDFQNTLMYKKTSISNVEFDEITNKHVFYISSPVLDSKQNLSAVLRAKVNADFFQNVIMEQAANQEPDSDITILLIDQNGMILAHSSLLETRYKLIAPLPKNQIDILQREHILAPGNVESLVLDLSDLEKGLSQANQNSFFYTNLYPNNEKSDVVKQKNLTTYKSWKIIVGRPTSSFSESANNQIRATIIIAMIVMLIALAAAIITSDLLTSPLNYLSSIAKKINRGELDVAIKLNRRDEIGQLSEMLVTTTSELKQALETLETQVEQRTNNLTITMESGKKRTEQLRSIIEITRSITSIQNFNELLPEIVRKVSLTFGFYHVGIFLTDQTGQYSTLQAASSEMGQKMLERGYQVKIGQNDNIGFVTSSGQPRITLDMKENTTPSDSTSLSDTHSQIVLPLRIDENTIGVIDIQSKEEYAFGSEDIDSFSLLASQISIAIQNAQLFEQTYRALAEAQVFYRQSATASWRDVLRQGNKGYRYLNGNTESIKTINEHSAKTTEQNITKGVDENNTELLNIPIAIRGKNLGTLSIRQSGRSHPWNNSEIRVYQSIVDRISFALENARLYQDAQRRASKERVISEISTRVSSSVNMDNILQTAVEELGHVLPGSEVVIQFEHDDETSAEFKAQE